MPDHTVRQFRPDAMDMLYEDPGFPRPLDSEISQLLAYIERLENALDFMGGAKSLLTIEQEIEDNPND